MKTVALIAIILSLGGCAVYPAGYYYAPAPVYAPIYAAPVYVIPTYNRYYYYW